MFSLTLSKIQEIYEKHLRNESFKNSIERYIGKEKWFHASSAGHCYRKQAYRKSGAKGKEPDFKGLMRMRIGDLIHRDLQEAISKYYDGIKDVEGNIEIDKLNVRGYYDLITIENDEIEIIDIKTMSSFPWRRKFGRIENRDTNPSKKYELQIGTYALGLISKYNMKISKMKILYYKKDDSTMKEVVIPKEYIDKAKEYWERVDELCVPEIRWDDMEPGESYGCPFESWECKFCQYEECRSPFK